MIDEKINQVIPSSKKNRSSLFFLAALLGVVFVVIIIFPFSSPEKTQPVKTQEAPPLPKKKVIAGKIAKKDTLSSALRLQNLPADLIESICRHLKPVLNLRRVKPGDTFEVCLTPEGKFLGFSYQSSPIDIYQLAVGPSGDWIARKLEVPVEKYWARISGEISGSLFEAMDKLGEQDPLVLDFAEIFAWEIDFNTEPQPGDRFQVVVEKYYAGETFVKYGRILYGEYKSASKRIQGLFYKTPGGRGDYYTSQGRSLRKAFLRSPLKFTRITSGYSKSRQHPILGGRRPHYGIDYAAPPGTPILAFADGVVIACGWNGGYGKQVIIKHVQGYQSMYGHLSRFAPGIRIGKSVHQKQVLGYVGSTGLSTGPHLDFRLLKNSVFCNPLKEISPRASSLNKDQMDRFAEATDPVVRWVQETPPEIKYRKVASLTSKEIEKR